MSRPRLEITSRGVVGPASTVQLDGVDISNALRGLRLNMAVGDVASAELDVMVVETTAVDIEATAHIPPEARDLLIRLGWTPPEDS